MAAVSYESDIVAWAKEQARLLRTGQFSSLDIEHIAEEIEDVGKSEQRELESRMAVLVAHLLKWSVQPPRRGSSWVATIKTQRAGIARRLRKTPSLKASLSDADWWADVWDDARTQVAAETQIPFDRLPADCPWSVEQILSLEFLPD
jgi:hypothetical protein